MVNEMRARSARSIALAIMAVGLCLQPGFAASLPSSSDGIGAATVTLPRCTAAALTVVPTIVAANVTAVVVSGIPSTCGSATLQAAMNNGLANSTGSAAIPAGGGSVTVTLALPVALTAGTQVDAIIVGP